MGKLNFKLGMAGIAYWFAALYAANTSALSLSQQPLFLVAGAEPNIMFVIDDSGSMAFEITPESYRFKDAVYGFPPTTNYYGYNPFSYRVPSPGNKSVFGKLFRSKVNVSYYDPSKRYLPWVSTDGSTLMPNASPTCAYHNPMHTGTTAYYCRNLTVDSTATFDSHTSSWVSCTSSSSCTVGPSGSGSWTYYPATYYYYTGGSGGEWTDANYTEVKISSSTATYTGHGRELGNRTDCNVVSGVVTCTYDQEIQNFANWYTYYRSRTLTARAGIGRAFSQQQDDIRVGFGSINSGSTDIDSVSTSVIKSGVRVFDSSRKTTFLDELYSSEVNGGTPLRNALDKIGTYYKRTDNGGPWSKDPATKDSSAHVQCRASYALLMSDGYWNGSTPSNIGEQDNSSGSTITNQGNTGPASYTYSPAAPFAASQGDTLADVAMKYWKNDLRTDINNRVKPNAVDPAFWQHMTTFTIGLGVDGTISPAPDVADSILNGTSITWPTINSSVDDGRKVDDMVHAAINGHGDFFSAGDPDTFAESLAGLLRDINQRESNNAAAAAANSTNLNTGSVVYNALFNSTDWSGELKATEINPDGTFGNDLWAASIPSASARKIYTFNGSAGTEFLWANLTATQKSLLQDGGSTAAGQALLSWVRGVNDATTNDTYSLRNREHILGDIVNSDPSFSGNTNLRYDRLSSALGGSSYLSYYNTYKKGRREVLYVGANDGMLHGFNASLSGTIPAGQEVFAYIPNQVYTNLPNVASAKYGQDNQHLHRYMVDGPVYTTDAYINGRWRNILVGTLGAGGKGIYVLDVTDPDHFGASNVLFELTEANYPQLGNITGLPIVAPGKDDRWKIYIGNGYNSTSASPSKAYLGIIDIADEYNKALGSGSTSRTKFIEASVSSDSGSENALAQPALLPDPTGRVVAAYAGDLRGNLWKFDLSSSSTSSWTVAYSNTPLYVAKYGSTRQSITASPTLGFNTELAPASVMVYFGTGRYIATSDNQVSNAIQSFYAIADKGAAISSGRTNLHEKSIASSSTTSKRYINGEVTSTGANDVDWASVDGWFLDFPENERINTKPLLLYDRLIFATIIPSEDSCESGGSGWLMELIAVGNSSLTYKLLGDNGNVFSDVAIFGQLTSLEGTFSGGGQASSNASSTSSGSSSSPGNECGAGTGGGNSGTIAVVGIRSNGEQVSTTGGRPCELFNRQSWRQLE